MHALYFFSVWLHILAAIAWVGGIFFLVLVVVPWLRAGNQQQAGTLLRDTGRRFRFVGWVCFAIVFITGSFNLWIRGVCLSSFADAGFRDSSFGRAVLLKLGVFAIVLLLSAIHDFWVGPAASEAMAAAPGSEAAKRLRRRASVMGRVTALLSLLLVGIGVALVRGAPF